MHINRRVIEFIKIINNEASDSRTSLFETDSSFTYNIYDDPKINNINIKPGTLQNIDTLKIKAADSTDSQL